MDPDEPPRQPRVSPGPSGPLPPISAPRQPSDTPSSSEKRASTTVVPPVVRRTGSVKSNQSEDPFEDVPLPETPLPELVLPPPTTPHKPVEVGATGWQRFTQKVFSAAGSYDAGSFQIPQRVLHLANNMALRDRDPSLTSASRGAEFVNHEKNPTASLLFLGPKYTGGESRFHPKALLKGIMPNKAMKALLGGKKDAKGTDGSRGRRGGSNSSGKPRKGAQAFMTDGDLENVLVRREYMTNPYQDRMAELTQGRTFGLLRPTTNAVGSPTVSLPTPSPTEGVEPAEVDPVHTFQQTESVRPFAKFAQSAAADGKHMSSVLCEEWGLDVPRVVVSVIGDRRVPTRLSTEKKLRLREAFAAAAYADSIWFITTGWELGVAGLAGEFIASSPNPTAVIGVSAWETLDSTEDGNTVKGQLEDCNGRLRAVHAVSQDTRRMKESSTADTPNNSADSALGIAVDHTHHLFIETGEVSPEVEDASAVAEFTSRTRTAEQEAILRLIAALTCEGGGEGKVPVKSYGAFGIRSAVVPAALIAAGGPDALRDALGYLKAGIPLVSVEGCSGASDVISKRYKLEMARQELDVTTEGGRAALIALKKEYRSTLLDSFLDESREALDTVGGLVKEIIATALALESKTKRPMIYVGILGAEELVDRPEAAIFRAVRSHPSFAIKECDADASFPSAAELADDRTQRALRIETAIKWKMASTREEQVEEFQYFRILPTLATDAHGHSRDPVLEPQLQMLEYVLKDYHVSGSNLARVVLDNITDSHLKQCLSYTIMPPDDDVDALADSTSTQQKGNRVERKVCLVPGTDNDSDSAQTSESLTTSIVDDFDDSDYSLPVHLSKAKFTTDVTQCIMEAWKKKRRLQRLRQKQEARTDDDGAKFVVRNEDTDDDSYADRFKRKFATDALLMVKYMLANGYLISRQPPDDDKLMKHIGLLPPKEEDRVPFPGTSDETEKGNFAKEAAKNVAGGAAALAGTVGSTMLGVAGAVVFGDAVNEKCTHADEKGELCNKSLQPKKAWCELHACPRCQDHSKEAAALSCVSCAQADAAQRAAFKHLRNQIAKYRYLLWRERKLRGRPVWRAAPEYTAWVDGDNRDASVEWTHPSLQAGKGERDALTFHLWYAEELLVQFLDKFTIYRTTMLEDMYAFGGDTELGRRQLAHMGVLFPRGLFAPSYVCLKVEQWLGVPREHRGLIERQQSEDPYFALYLWALLTNRLRIALLMLTKRPGEIVVNALVGALICDSVIKELHNASNDVDVAPEVEVQYVNFRAHLLEIAHKVLELAYSIDSEMTVKALQSPWPNSGGIEAWALAYEVNARQITAMPAHRMVVDSEWWGSVDPDNGFIKILLSIFTGGLYLLFWTPHDADDFYSGRAPKFRNCWYLPVRVSTARGDAGRLDGDMARGSGTTNHPPVPGDGSFRSWRTLAGRRWYRFLTAPQVSYYIECIFYMLYLLVYSYATLLAPRPWSEVFEFTAPVIDDFAQITALVFILSNVFEEIREATWSIKEWSAMGVSTGLGVWWSSYWNRWDFVMYAVIITGVWLKLSDSGVVLESSKICLAFGALLLWLRSMRYFAKFPMLGPKTLMVFKMLEDFRIFVCMLFTGLMGSGVAMYSVAQPWRGVDEGTPIDLFYKPTFQMFGELFLEETFEETGCSMTDSASWRSCQGNWYFAMILLIAYMLYSNILLVNLLIAMMSATYDAIEENSFEFWSIQNIQLLREMQEDEFPQPPPLNFVAYVGRFFRFLYRRATGSAARSRKVHPRHGSQDGPRLKRQRRDLPNLGKIIAFMVPYGTAAVKELDLLQD